MTFSFTRILLCTLVLQYSAIGFSGQTIRSQKTHKIKVFNGGLASFDERLAMIERAKQTIEVEYFLYSAEDVSARVFTQALARKAASGVEVRILLDAFSLTVEINPYLADRLKEAGVQIRYFNPDSLALHMLNHRNHRKTVIVDGREFMVGGRNVEDKYFDLDPKYNFLDRDAWVQGPIVPEVQASFYRIWESRLTKQVPKARQNTQPSATKGNSGALQARIKHRKLTELSKDFLRENKTDSQVRALASNWIKGQRLAIPTFEGPVTFITDYDNGGVTWSAQKREDHLWDVVLANVNKAKTSVLVESPYLVLKNDDLELISGLKKRGLKVEALTNSPMSTDSKITSTVYFAAGDDIARRGAEISCYDSTQPKNYPLARVAEKARWGIHSKTLVVDGKHTAIGTYNIDPRSKSFNLESMIYFPNNPAIAKYVSADIRSRMKQSFSFFKLNPDTQLVEQLRSDCKDMTWLECLSYRLQRPIGQLVIDLL